MLVAQKPGNDARLHGRLRGCGGAPARCGLAGSSGGQSQKRRPAVHMPLDVCRFSACCQSAGVVSLASACNQGAKLQIRTLTPSINVCVCVLRRPWHRAGLSCVRLQPVQTQVR